MSVKPLLLRPVSSVAELEGSWWIEDMYTTTTSSGGQPTISRPFGTTLTGYIHYVANRDCATSLMVHALITASHSSASGTEDVGLGDFFWSAPAASARLVTHYVGSAVVLLGDVCRVEHRVAGSAHRGYVGRTLTREAQISPDGTQLVLSGSLGMKEGVMGTMVWRRVTTACSKL